MPSAVLSRSRLRNRVNLTVRIAFCPVSGIRRESRAPVSSSAKRAASTSRISASASADRHGRSRPASGRRMTSASRSSLASSTRKRGSTVAGSATTRRRRQAGPPPLAIDWRTSTNSTRRIGAVGGEVPLDPAPDRRRVAALGRRDQRHRAVGRRHQLGVEQIGADRIGQRHLGVGHLDHLEARAPAARSSVDQRVAVGERLLVREQHRARWRPRRRHCGTRRRRSLPRDCCDEHGPLRIEPVEPRDRLRCLDMLAGGEGAAATRHRRTPRRPARHAPAPAACDWPRPRRRTPAAPGRAPRNAVVGEGQPQLRQRRRPFVAAVRHGLQVGDGQVALAVGGVGRGLDGRGIGRPHRRGAHRIGGERRLGLLDRRAKLGEPRAVRPRRAARKCPAPARARGWRASCRGPAAPPRAAARPRPALRVEARLPRLRPA